MSLFGRRGVGSFNHQIKKEKKEKLTRICWRFAWLLLKSNQIQHWPNRKKYRLYHWRRTNPIQIHYTSNYRTRDHIFAHRKGSFLCQYCNCFERWPVRTCARNTLRELIFGAFADYDPNRKIKFPQNFSYGKNKGRIIHRTALIFFQVRNPQN